MVTVHRAQTWLNLGRPSETDPCEQAAFQILQSKQRPDEEKWDEVEILNGVLTYQLSPMRAAEIRANLGVFFYEIGEFSQAYGHFLASASLYAAADDRHSEAVALWMQQLSARHMGRRSEAFALGRRSRRIFIDLRNEGYRTCQKSSASWYEDRIIDLSCDLLRDPYDASGWLREFGDGQLGGPLLDVMNRAQNHVDSGQADLVQKEIAFLLDLCAHASSQEKAAAFAFSAAAASLFDAQFDSALNYLRSAAAVCDKDCHCQMVIHWMLGLLMHRDPRTRTAAVTMLERVIQENDFLYQCADHQKNLDRTDWYRWHQAAMRRVLNEIVRVDLADL